MHALQSVIGEGGLLLLGLPHILCFGLRYNIKQPLRCGETRCEQNYVVAMGLGSVRMTHWRVRERVTSWCLKRRCTLSCSLASVMVAQPPTERAQTSLLKLYKPGSGKPSIPTHIPCSPPKPRCTLVTTPFSALASWGSSIQLLDGSARERFFSQMLLPLILGGEDGNEMCTNNHGNIVP
eukprot:6145341-Amphidinium_carterae.1